MIEPILRAAIMIVVIILVTRMAGLRSFSKMSNFDFALTIATGSVIATAIVDSTLDLRVAIAAILAIFAFQALIAWGRVKSRRFSGAVDNTPLLLMDGPRILSDNLKTARVSEDDLFAKLRKANVLHTDQVVAVILETSGDVSVLHSHTGKSLADGNVAKDIRRD